MLYPFHGLENIFLHRDFIDFRKGINGLVEVVLNEFEQSPQSSSLFVFCNKSRDKVKVLYWDKTGFCLWQKRLEEAKFKWPKTYNCNSITLDHEKLEWLLKGIDISQLKPHKPLNYDGF